MKSNFFILLLLSTSLLILSCQQQQEKKVNEKVDVKLPLNKGEKAKKITHSEVVGVDAKDISFRDESGVKTAFKGEKPFTGTGINFFKNGKKQYSTTYKNGLKEGEWRIWFPNGNVNKIGNTLNGEEHGIYQEFYEEGQIKYEYHYDLGKKINVWKSWYENGQQWTSRDFKNDKLDGKVLVWDTDGTLTKEYTYRNGALIDKQFYFEE